MAFGVRERIKENDKPKPTRYFSKKQENQVAEKFNGRRNPNSGATPFIKSDVSLDKFLLECKTKMTKCGSISIKKEWLEKVNEEAVFMGKPYSALVFNYGPDEKNYVIINEDIFNEILENMQN